MALTFRHGFVIIATLSSKKKGDGPSNRRPAVWALGQGLVSLLIMRHGYCNRTHNLVAGWISTGNLDGIDATTAFT